MSEDGKAPEKQSIYNIYVSQGDVGAIGPGAQGAIHKGTSVQSQTPSKSEVHWTEEGDQHRAARRYLEALDCYEQALKQDGGYLIALQGKALALFYLNHELKALAAANEALQLYPQDVEAHYTKGLILAGMRRHEEAVNVFDQAIALDGHYEEAHAAKVQALADQGKYAEAAAALEQALAQHPKGRAVRQAPQSLNQLLPVGKLLCTLKGHARAVLAVAWSPDGRRLASASEDKTVRLWDVASGQSLASLEGHADYVNQVAWSPDGRFLASASDDSTIRLWDGSHGQLLSRLICHSGAVAGVTWSPDGHYLASAGSDQAVGCG